MIGSRPGRRRELCRPRCWRTGSSAYNNRPDRAEKVAAPLAPKMVNCSAAGIPASVVMTQPSAHRNGIAAAHHQRRRVRAVVPESGRRRGPRPVRAAITAMSASDVSNPTTVAPSSRPPPMPSAVARIHGTGRSRPRLTSHCPAPTTAPVTSPASRAATGSSTRPATARPARPAIGKARNPAVQISHDPKKVSRRRTGVSIMRSPALGTRPHWLGGGTARTVVAEDEDGEDHQPDAPQDVADEVAEVDQGQPSGTSTPPRMRTAETAPRAVNQRRAIHPPRAIRTSRVQAAVRL